MTAGFGEAPLIRNEGFGDDPTDDKTNGRFKKLIEETIPEYEAGRHGVSAAMVAGFTTVSCPKLEADDTILLSHFIVGGTPGHLSIGVRTVGVSFTVLSTSNTDTSTVAWKIEKKV